MTTKILFAVLLLGTSIARAEVKPGENYFDVVRAIAKMNERAPEHLRAIKKLLEESCTAGSPARACSFPALLQAHAEAFKDWKDLADGQNPFESSTILLRPRWNYQDVRGGIWNLPVNNQEETARLSALAAARFVASSVVLERAFAEVADWMATWGDPKGAFQPVIRPVVAAFLSSGNPLTQIATFSSQMNCREDQSACRAVKSRVGAWIAGKSGVARELATVLKNERFADDPELVTVYQANMNFRAYLEKDWWEVGTRLGKPETLLELPEFKAYADYLAARALNRKNLMGGPYSLADEVLATVLLADLAHLSVPAQAESVPLSQEGEAAFAQLDTDFERAFAPYAKALEALR